MTPGLKAKGLGLRGLPLSLSLWPLALSPAVAGDFSREAIGAYGAQELELAVGARGAALGEAMSAVADDATAIHWNPAGLMQIPSGSAAFMHATYFGSISYDHFAYAHRVGERQVLGGAVQALDLGTLERRDVNNVAQGDFHPRSLLYSLAFAQSVHEIEEGGDIAAGFTAKVLQSKIVESAQAYAFDLGFTARIPAEIPNRVGFVVRNLGVGPQFDVDRERLPFQIRGGTAFSPGAWILSLEGVAPRGNAPYAAAGVEYSRGWTRTLNGSLRAGYNSLALADGPAGSVGPSFGIGVTVAGFSFDYAVVPFGDLGVSHQLSIQYELPAFAED